MDFIPLIKKDGQIEKNYGVEIKICYSHRKVKGIRFCYYGATVQMYYPHRKSRKVVLQR